MGLDGGQGTVEVDVEEAGGDLCPAQIDRLGVVRSHPPSANDGGDATVLDEERAGRGGIRLGIEQDRVV